MTKQTRIGCEVDLEGEGKQTGFLRVPHSVHRSAYGWIPIPIVVFKNGSGPTVLLTAGNHGDEYEGQLALMKLIRDLAPEDVQGRIIVLTAANYPAVLGGLRTSPIDDLNLNRCFPGEPDGQPTMAIAHFIEAELLTLADLLLDFHSGGSSLMYVPSVVARLSSDERVADRQRQLIDAFAAPITYVVEGRGEDRTMLAAAARCGVPAIGTELGGGGTTTLESLAVGEQGLRRVLRDIGVAPSLVAEAPESPTRMMHVRGPDYYIHSPEYGIWEPLVELGDDVVAGQPAALIHCPETPWRAPVSVSFERAGSVICRRVPSGVQRGDCLYHLATDFD